MANFINTTLCFCNIFHKNNENEKKSLLYPPKCGILLYRLGCKQNAACRGICLNHACNAACQMIR